MDSSHAKTVTVIGQGYVGLPLAQAAARQGWKVWGLDTSEELIGRLNSGSSHIDDLSNSDLGEMLSLGYEATVDPTCIGQSAFIVVCVPTPLGEANSPDLKAIEAATRVVGQHISRGATYILESTTYPGTTDEICLPILETESGMHGGDDFHIAYSPERVDPGSKKFGIENTPKLVGGMNAKSTSSAVGFYSTLVREVVPMNGTREAETAKLLENTFRHVNIALVNEMAKFCHELNIDIWEVIRGASTKPFGFMKFTPGPGVGGHCIPIDPNYLSYQVRSRLGYPFRFVELAQEVNQSMPKYVVDRAAEVLNGKELSVKGARILLLGVTYKADIADERESPAQPIAEELNRRGAVLSFHDPYVENWKLQYGRTLSRVENLDNELGGVDLVVILQRHSEYNLSKIQQTASTVFDTVGATSGNSSYRL